MPSNGESLDGDIISALVGQAAERRLALRIGDSTRPKLLDSFGGGIGRVVWQVEKHTSAILMIKWMQQSTWWVESRKLSNKKASNTWRSPEVCSRSSRLTSAKYWSSSVRSSYPISCWTSIAICSSSFRWVAWILLNLSCTWTHWYKHCPCVVSSSLVITPVAHCSPMTLDPSTVVYSSCRCRSPRQIIPSMNLLQPIASCSSATLRYLSSMPLLGFI